MGIRIQRKMHAQEFLVFNAVEKPLKLYELVTKIARNSLRLKQTTTKRVRKLPKWQ